MRNALLALILLAPQEEDLEKKVAELVEKLSDDIIDVRDQAAEELLELGRPAEGALRKHLASAEGETKARIEGILKELDRRERMKDYLGGVTLVTLKKDKAPLKDVLEELKKQTKMKIQSGMAPRDDLVTVDIEKLPLLHAVDALCRAHGGVMYQVDTYGAQATLTITKQKYVPYPAAFKDQFFVQLREVMITRHSDFMGGGEQTGSELVFQAGWEAGTKPVKARLRISAIEDDQGKSYLDDVKKDEFDYGWGSYVPNQYRVQLHSMPQESAKKLARVAGTIEFSFPLDMDVLKIDAASLKKDATAKGNAIEVKLVDVSKSGGEIRLKIALKKVGEHFEPEFKLIGKAGREFSSSSSSTSYGGDQTTYDRSFRIGDAEIMELRITALVGSREVTIPFDFKDVRIR